MKTRHFFKSHNKICLVVEVESNLALKFHGQRHLVDTVLFLMIKIFEAINLGLYLHQNI